MSASAGSSFIAATIASGLMRVLLRSRITSVVGFLRIVSSAPSTEREKRRSTLSWLAAVLIFELNMRSSSTAKIIASMIVESQAVGPFFKNGFVVGCEETRGAVIIDPGDEVASLLEFAGRNRLAIRHILLTHAHIDHVTGVAAAKRTLNAPIYLHKDDLFLYERAVEMGAMFSLKVEPQPPIDVF